MRNFTFETIYPIFNFKKYKRNSPAGDGFSKKFLVLVVVSVNSTKITVPPATSTNYEQYTIQSWFFMNYENALQYIVYKKHKNLMWYHATLPNNNHLLFHVL
jgi:hypothetical protein